MLVSAISPSYLVYRFLRLVNSRDNPRIPFYNHFTIPWIDHEFTITMVLWFDPTRKKTSQWYTESIYRMSHWFYFFRRMFLVSLFSSLGPASTRCSSYIWWQLALRRPRWWGAGVGFFRRVPSKNVRKRRLCRTQKLGTPEIYRNNIIQPHLPVDNLLQPQLPLHVLNK